MARILFIAIWIIWALKLAHHTNCLSPVFTNVFNHTLGLYMDSLDYPQHIEISNTTGHIYYVDRSRSLMIIKRGNFIAERVKSIPINMIVTCMTIDKFRHKVYIGTSHGIRILRESDEQLEDNSVTDLEVVDVFMHKRASIFLYAVFHYENKPNNILRYQLHSEGHIVDYEHFLNATPVQGAFDQFAVDKSNHVYYNTKIGTNNMVTRTHVLVSGSSEALVYPINITYFCADYEGNVYGLYKTTAMEHQQLLKLEPWSYTVKTHWNLFAEHVAFDEYDNILIVAEEKLYLMKK